MRAGPGRNLNKPEVDVHGLEIGAPDVVLICLLKDIGCTVRRSNFWAVLISDRGTVVSPCCPRAPWTSCRRRPWRPCRPPPRSTPPPASRAPRWSRSAPQTHRRDSPTLKRVKKEHLVSLSFTFFFGNISYTKNS